MILKLKRTPGIFLVGFMGCGKSTVGHALADELGWRFVDLDKEIEGVQGRELRLSSAVIQPGAHVGLHSHRGDPSIVYILSGVLTNHHDDGITEEFHAGQACSEYGPRSHWVENKGSAPVRFIVANVGQE